MTEKPLATRFWLTWRQVRGPPVGGAGAPEDAPEDGSAARGSPQGAQGLSMSFMVSVRAN
ncbi:hypothetical protein GCM10010335_24850 [Streptomyces galbus]|nr:hypothetical protein GCM10010335_24850 [Streptomyces galbus]